MEVHALAERDDVGGRVRLGPARGEIVDDLAGGVVLQQPVVGVGQRQLCVDRRLLLAQRVEANRIGLLGDAEDASALGGLGGRGSDGDEDGDAHDDGGDERAAGAGMGILSWSFAAEDGLALLEHRAGGPRWHRRSDGRGATAAVGRRGRLLARRDRALDDGLDAGQRQRRVVGYRARQRGGGGVELGGGTTWWIIPIS